MDDDEIYTPTHNALSGQTVSSMYKLKDIDNHGTFATSLVYMLSCICSPVPFFQMELSSFLVIYP